MPITQGQMIEQMQEARNLHTALVQIREGLSAYLQSARERYPQNAELQEVVLTALYTIKSAPVPDDRATYVNERHYSRRAKWNIKAQADQERKRRLLGIPEKHEAMGILHARNAQARQLAVDTTLSSDPFATGMGKSDQERAAEQILAGVDEPAVRMPSRQHSRPGLKMPRDDPDDPELEFETPEELAPIANLPTGAVDAIVDPLAPQGENNSQEGIDIPADLLDDNNGNPAKGE